METAIGNEVFRALDLSKTNLRQLAEHLGITLMELDRLLWTPNNYKASLNEKLKSFFREHGLETDFERAIAMSQSTLFVAGLPRKTRAVIARLMVLNLNRASYEDYKKLIETIETIESKSKNEGANKWLRKRFLL